MPDVYRFELERRGSIVDTHDLLSQMRVVVGSWRETPQGGRVVVTCTLTKQDTADPANIRAAIDDLEEFMNRALEYSLDHLESYECWFRWQTSGEDVKRSLVYSSNIEPIDHEVDDIHLDSGAGRYLFTFSRDLRFEELTSQAALQNNISSVGGYVNLISTISGGSADGRIVNLILKPRNASNNLYKAWVGIRPERYGIGSPTQGDITAGFHPVINFSLASQADGSYTSLTVPSVANAYNGYVVRDSFADYETLNIKLEASVASDYYTGRYLVLLRAGLTAGSTICSARIGTAFGAFGDVGAFYDKPLSLGNTQYIEDTVYRFYELGIIDIPGDRTSHVPYRTSINIFLETGRVSGSGSLDTDCLVLVPADHYITWDKAGFGNAIVIGAFIGDANVRTNPEGSVSGVVVDPRFTGGAAVGSIGGIAFDYAELGGGLSNWAYPRHGGFLVIAAEREDSQTVTDYLDIEIYVRRRWRIYRV